MVPEKVQNVIDAHGLQVHEFEPGSTPTVEMAARRLGVEPARIAKSLLFKSKAGAFVMVVCPGDKRIPSGVLRQVIGSKVSMTSAEETEQATGFRPGGVCPFGLEGVEILLDQDLGLYETVFPAAGNDATGVRTTLAQLVQVTGGRVVEFRGAE